MHPIDILARTVVPGVVGGIAGYSLGTMDAPPSDEVKVALTEHSRRRIEEAMESLVRARKIEELKQKVLGDGQTLRL